MRKIKERKLGESDLETLDQQVERLTQARDRAKRDQDVAAGIAYMESLAGSTGMNFVLLPDPHHTQQDIERAASYLFANRDVVSINFVRIESYRA